VPEADPDDALVARAAAGDGVAFDALIDRHAARVYGICWHYFGDADDAEDAAQAAFLACFRGLPKFRGGAAFSTWLYRITTNACHDLARRRARTPRTVSWEADRTGAVDDPPDEAAVDRLAAAELHPDLVAALGALDAGQRQAVVLRDVIGASYADISRIQGVAVGTAKSRVHRGHVRLSELLAPMRNSSATSGGPTVQDAETRR
jgi:RNA polymerase sigma-70 factor (ECF subfamily)